MRKSDKSIRNVSIAAIRRSTIKPYDFKWTKFYDAHSYFTYQGLKLGLGENELIICSTIIDDVNYSILTTRRLITMENGYKRIGLLEGATDKGYGIFKGYNKESVTCGLIGLKNGAELTYFIEVGQASMIMIQGVRTAIGMNESTD
ncbi:MAG: hypothetical protein AAF206_12475 [Bacteroidota bacterium]